MNKPFECITDIFESTANILCQNIIFGVNQHTYHVQIKIYPNFENVRFLGTPWIKYRIGVEEMINKQ